MLKAGINQLVLSSDSMVKIKDLFGGFTELKKKGGPMPGRTKSGSYIENPMHVVYGKTEGKKCKNCVHILKKVYSNTYYKCKLRNNVDKASPKSDHRLNWVACGKFEKNV